MSIASERYVRCPHCNALYLEGSGICSECAAQVDEQLPGELRRVASDVWVEVWRPTASAAAGLGVGGLLVVGGALASRGLWLSSLAELLTPPTRPGVVYLTPFLLSTVLIVWLILGRLEVHQFGGRVELFDTDEVQAGAWACGLLTVILAAVSLCLFKASPVEGPSPGWFWQLLPLFCQTAAIAVAVSTSRWLQARELEREFAAEALSPEDAP